MPEQPPPRFSRGASVLYRELVEGRQISHIKPATVVEDSEERLVLWTPAGSTVLYAEALHVDADGTRRWDRGWRLTETEWKADVIYVMWPGQMHKYEVRREPDGAVRSSKFSLQSAVRRTHLGFDRYGYKLHLLIAPDGRLSWKNEKDLALAIEQGRMTPAHGDAVRAAGEGFAAAVRRNQGPSTQGWETWRPDADLPHPTLPEDWGDLSMYPDDLAPERWADDLLA